MRGPIDRSTYLGALVSLGVAGVGLGQQTPADAQPPEPAAETETPEGLLPLPDYTGDFWTRSRLTGEWGGTRSEWARKGILLDLDWTQTVQGVIAGGRRIDW